MLIGETIKLEKPEQSICRKIASLRYGNAREKGIYNKKVGKQSNEMTDLEGFGGELAFCKGFNLFPDFTVWTRGTETDIGDAKLPCGLTVDVKTTVYPTGRLTAALWKNETVDLFALMTGNFPEYIFRGFLEQKKLMKKEMIGDLGRGPLYMADQSILKSLPQILSPLY
tara:strand:- start:418 stop:924 length:507 start_codon:yes stop_codon:yes gene_type:complete